MPFLGALYCTLRSVGLLPPCHMVPLDDFPPPCTGGHFVHYMLLLYRVEFWRVRWEVDLYTAVHLVK